MAGAHARKVEGAGAWHHTLLSSKRFSHACCQSGSNHRRGMFVDQCKASIIAALLQAERVERASGGSLEEDSSVCMIRIALVQAERVEGASSSSEEEDGLEASTSGSDGETAEGEREARHEARAERRRKAADARTRRAAASILDGESCLHLALVMILIGMPLHVR